MLNNFRNAICSNNDLKRVIGVHYPRDEELSVPDLADFVTTEYLTPLRNDPRGYVVVSQSFSGHVGMNLAHKPAPGIMIGQVFVNAFVSPPGPSWIQNGRLRLPSNFFQRQPPPWMVSSMFLGAGGSGMDIVQAAGAKVAPHVMRQRLDICLAHDSWATWRCTDTLPGNRTLYIRGDADAIVANDAAEQMRKARPDIFWESVPDGPHLLLQRFGRPAARSVHKFCERLSSL